MTTFIIYSAGKVVLVVKASKMLCIVRRGCVVLVGLFLFVANLDAASVIYQFEPISTCLLPDSSSPEVQAIFEDEKPGTVRLTITSDLAGGEFLGNLYFNFDPMDNVNRLHFIPLGARSQPLPKILAGRNSFKADGGYYDICFAFGTVGKNRCFGENSITYLITERGLDASDFVFMDSTGRCGGTCGTYYAMVRIQGSCGHGQWLAASTTALQAVPEPAAVALLASAGGVGWCVCSRSGTRRFIKRWFNPQRGSWTDKTMS